VKLQKEVFNRDIGFFDFLHTKIQLRRSKVDLSDVTKRLPLDMASSKFNKEQVRVR
jgi:hypothetical protein